MEGPFDNRSIDSVAVETQGCSGAEEDLSHRHKGQSDLVWSKGWKIFSEIGLSVFGRKGGEPIKNMGPFLE